MLIGVGEDIIAVGIEDIIFIFNKETGELVYQSMSHGLRQLYSLYANIWQICCYHI